MSVILPIITSQMDLSAFFARLLPIQMGQPPTQHLATATLDIRGFLHPSPAIRQHQHVRLDMLTTQHPLHVPAMLLVVTSHQAGDAPNAP